MTPTDGSASTSKLSTWALRFGSFALAAALIFAGVVLVAYIALRLQAVSVQETGLSELRVQVGELAKRQDELRDNLNARLGELEFTVYGTLEPQAKVQARAVPRPIEPWMRNRDAELRKQIQALQRRLLELEQKP